MEVARGKMSKLNQEKNGEENSSILGWKWHGSRWDEESSGNLWEW